MCINAVQFDAEYDAGTFIQIRREVFYMMSDESFYESQNV